MTEEQALIVDEKLKEQFTGIKTIAAEVEQGLDFLDKRDQKILELITNQQNLSMLAYVDEKRNTISYQRKKLAGISNSEHFKDIWMDKEVLI